MKRTLRRICSLCLIIALAAAMLLHYEPSARAAPEENPVLRIGLYYGTTALSAANLQNFTGSGYRLGYLENGRQFVALGRIDDTKITILKNRNMYLSGGTYSDSATSGAAIGCYHIDTGDTFGSFDEARQRADVLNGQGLDAFPVYASGVFRVRIGAYTSSSAAQSNISSTGLSGASAVTGSAYCVSVVKTGTTSIVFQYDGGAGSSLAIWPSRGEVSDPVTWFKGYKYRGCFEYRRIEGNNISVVNVVSMQDYIKGVIPYEMSPSWPLEALKAQSLCAKSYAMNSLNKHKAYGFDLCATTDCQVYFGTGNASANSDRAVNETLGYYVYYGNKVAQTFFHSSDGGSTESAVNVWGTDIPYLQAVTDNYEDLSRATNGIWQYKYTKSSLTKILSDKGYSNGGIVDAYIDKFTPAGNVYRLTLVDSGGKKFNFERERARTILSSSSLGLYTYSQRYTINGAGSDAGGASALYIAGAKETAAKNGTGELYAISADGVAPVTGSMSDVRLRAKNGVYPLAVVSGESASSSADSYLISGRGWGHNVGMSQYGAKGMAERGFTFEEIIQFYFRGATVGN